MIKDRRLRRHLHIKKKIKGTSERPRLLVKRSNRHTYAILINDEQGRVLSVVSTLSKEMREKVKNSPGKIEAAKEVGRLVAEKAKELNIKSVAFDRGGYKYHGRVRAVAEGAREGGLKF